MSGALPLPHRERALVRTLVLVSLAAGVLATFSWGLQWAYDFPLGVIYVLVVSSFVASGVFLLHDRSTGRTGWAMIVAGFCYDASWWWIWPESWQAGPAPLVSFTIGYWWFAIGGLALLRYPEPVLTRGLDRAYFVVLATWIAGLKLLIATVSEPAWSGYSSRAWWPTIAPSEGAFRALSLTFQVGLICLSLLLPVLLALKMRRMRGLERSETLPVTTAAIAIAVLGTSYFGARLLGLGAQLTDALRTITAIAALVAPVAFLVSLTQRRLARASVADLVVGLAACASLRDVQEALRRALGDPALLLAVPAGGPSRYLSCEGQPLTAEQISAWQVPMTGTDGRPLAVLFADTALRRRASLVSTAAIAGTFALENGLLHADLAAQLATVQASRRRITEAGLAERRRIERDLHDGAQQMLLKAQSSLSLAQLRVQEGREATQAIETARGDLQFALDELRNLARGIHSTLLNQSGLKAALQSIVERFGMPVVLAVEEVRLPEAVEATLYFVTCEALANVTKHSRATKVDVFIRVREGSAIARISDDGVGGANPGTGSGLAGLRDRVHALGGDMTIVSEPGFGTTVTARIPCASP